MTRRRHESRRARYIEELRGHADLSRELRKRGRRGKLTLVYAAPDTQHNDAVVLAPIIRRGFPRKGQRRRAAEAVTSAERETFSRLRLLLACPYRL